MNHVLHIVSGPLEPWMEALIKLQENQPESKVERVDLSNANVDFQEVVRQIFSADSVEVW